MFLNRTFLISVVSKCIKIVIFNSTNINNYSMGRSSLYNVGHGNADIQLSKTGKSIRQALTYCMYKNQQITVS